MQSISKVVIFNGCREGVTVQILKFQALIVDTDWVRVPTSWGATEFGKKSYKQSLQEGHETLESKTVGLRIRSAPGLRSQFKD